MPDASWELLVGDVREKLRGLPDESVHAVVTSPPYWGLRDYGTEPQVWGGDPDCEHEWGQEVGRNRNTPRRDVGKGFADPTGTRGEQKGNMATALDASLGRFCACGAWKGELGQEPHPDQFVAHLMEVFNEVRRVLRKDGVAFVNMDDTYCANRSYQVPSSKAGDVGNSAGMRVPDGLKPKELALVPARMALALQAAGWYVRCDGIWSKPNGMPESVTDRPTRSHEYLYMLTKSPRYFWDQEAVKEEGKDWSRGGPGVGIKETTHYGASNGGNSGLSDLAGRYKSGEAELLRNVRSVWTIPTESFPGAHFAVMAKQLAEKCILAATSERGVCASCGAPRVRRVDKESIDRSGLPPDHPEWRPRRYDDGKAGDAQSPGAGQRFAATKTVGWEPGCECSAEAVPATVLDPFGGAMTTALVSMRLGRSSVSVELSEEFAQLGRERMVTWWKDVRPAPVDESQLSLEVSP